MTRSSAAFQHCRRELSVSGSRTLFALNPPHQFIGG
jgi:hypothetical protein